jgi:Zn-finger nucleic acid-binding protein
VRNEIDLKGKYQYSIKTRKSNRICPHCDKPLITIKLDFKESLYIEHCKTCFGLFFDPGEIEALLQNSVSNVFDINLKLLKNINKDRYQKKPVKYVKCPVCRVLMNRVNYAHKSGVVIDQCKNHGIWVDSGEITHLMEWKKAGGELLDQKTKKRPKPKKVRPAPTYDLPVYQHQSNLLDVDIIEAVSSLVFKLFK